MIMELTNGMNSTNNNDNSRSSYGSSNNYFYAVKTIPIFSPNDTKIKGEKSLKKTGLFPFFQQYRKREKQYRGFNSALTSPVLLGKS